jgi:hypothetical protein
MNNKVMPDLDEILKKIWPQVRRRHLFPELPDPAFVEGEAHVGLDIKGKNISISKRFVEEMSAVLAPQEILEGLLDHAVCHYIYCPWNFATHLKLFAEAKTVLKDKRLAQRAADCFIDVVTDTLCVNQRESTLPKIYRHLRGGILDEAIHALYQKIWGIDLGVPQNEELSNRLARIPYWDRSRWMESIKRFIKLIQPLLDREKDEGSLDRPPSLGTHGIQQYAAQEIEAGLRQLAFDAASPVDFAHIVDDFEDEIIGVIQTAGQGSGPASTASRKLEVLYYMKLAESYRLPIRKAPMKKSGSAYPHHHISWEVGLPYQDIDPWTSSGKFMPGITQSWNRHEGEVLGKEDGIPDCMVLIDSSGSMKNPRHALSHAVLGAACACDSYLRNNARVAVYNFGDASAAAGRHLLPYSRSRTEIFDTLCRYFGGGTKFRVADVASLQKDPMPDLFLISDMQITNLEVLIRYFNECQNRVTVVHIGNNAHVDTFRSAMDLRSHVEIYAVERKTDIPRIVLGQIRQYLYSASF